MSIIRSLSRDWSKGFEGSPVHPLTLPHLLSTFTSPIFLAEDFTNAIQTKTGGAIWDTQTLI